MSLDEEVISWGTKKGIFKNSDAKSQCLKTVSEVGELAEAVNKGDLDEIIDAIGDIEVTLILLCKMYRIDRDMCLQSAYNVISKRTGKMVNGVFVKDG